MAVGEFLLFAALGGLPTLIGVGLGYYGKRFRDLLLVLTGLPAAYMTLNLAVALTRHGLRDTLLVGIPLGNSPVFMLLLSVVTGGLFVGVVVGSWWAGEFEIETGTLSGDQ